MTTGRRACTITEHPNRYPVRRESDGDFLVEEILAVVGTPDVSSGADACTWFAAWARERQLWCMGHIGDVSRCPLSESNTLWDTGSCEVTDDDLAVLRAFEVSPLWRPPVSTAVAELTPALAADWLTLARHWTGLSATTKDLRFFNAACKLLGAVWTQVHPDGSGTAFGDPGWSALAPAIATTALLVRTVTEEVVARLSGRKAVPTVAAVEPDPVLPQPPAHVGTTPSVVVLAAAGSSGAHRFLSAAHSASLPIAGVCWYGSEGAAPVRSAYTDAWYPVESSTRIDATGPYEQVRQTPATDWGEVASALRAYRADLVVLFGMPIVPEPVLNVARLGVVNAHNGALPGYRGMDAVGWAVFDDQAIVCTLHRATPVVDQGEVFASVPVAFTPRYTLRTRVKEAQLRLLLDVTRYVTSTGRLPAGTPQGRGRQFYRMHPHLKRILDRAATITDSSDPTGEEHVR